MGKQPNESPKSELPGTDIKCPICGANFYQTDIPILTIKDGMVSRLIDRDWDYGKIPQSIMVDYVTKYYCRKCESRLIRTGTILYEIRGKQAIT